MARGGDGPGDAVAFSQPPGNAHRDGVVTPHLETCKASLEAIEADRGSAPGTGHGDCLMAFPATEFRVRLLNCFEVLVNSRAIPIKIGAQRLVIFLALFNQALPRSYVAGVLWPDVATDRASANLRASIWRIPSPCRSFVDLKARHVGLAPGVSVDYLEAKALAHRLLDCQQSRDADLSRHARSELSSELLPSWYEEWVLVERERFLQLRVHALEAQCERLTVLGRYGEAIDAGLAAVCAEPLRESSHRVLIKAHLAEGNSAEARRQYELCRRVLHDELGVEPSDGLRNLATATSGARRFGADRRRRDTVHAHRSGALPDQAGQQLLYVNGRA